MLFSPYSALTYEGYPPFLFKDIECGAVILHLHLSLGNWLYSLLSNYQMFSSLFMFCFLSSESK